MSEAEFYLLLMRVVNKMRIPIVQLTVDFSGTSVVLAFQKTPYMKLDDEGINLRTYAEWLEKAKRASNKKAP